MKIKYKIIIKLLTCLLVSFSTLSYAQTTIPSCQSVLRGHANFLKLPLAPHEVSRDLTVTIVSADAHLNLSDSDTNRVQTRSFRTRLKFIGLFQNKLGGTGVAYKTPPSSSPKNDRLGTWSVTLDTFNGTLQIIDHNNRVFKFPLECRRTNTDNQVMLGVSTFFSYQKIGQFVLITPKRDVNYLVTISRSLTTLPN